MVTQRVIARFWAPLAATWLMMALEGPFVAAVIARQGDAKLNLAAFGIAFALGMVVESPIIMVMSAATALVRDRGTLLALRRFVYLANAAVTGVMVVLLLPPVFRTLTESLLGLDPAISRLTYGATVLLLPWPAAIGYRRFYQGVLISRGLTRRVAYGTVVRLSTMAGTALTLLTATDLPGAWVGGAALAAGVVAEAVASRIWAAAAVRELVALPDLATPPSMRAIFTFYLPLALTSVLGLAVNPMVTFFMGHGRNPLESLAVLPVVTGLVFVFRSSGIALQEVGIVLLGDRSEGLAPLTHFALVLGLGSAALLSAVAFTPLRGMWFSSVAGLPAELTAFATLPLCLLAVMPGLETMLSFERALLVHARRTRFITIATGIEVGVIAVTLLALVGWGGWIGAVAAALALLLGRLSSITFLVGPARAASRVTAGSSSPSLPTPE
jgi:progressive ankylosis protein